MSDITEPITVSFVVYTFKRDLQYCNVVKSLFYRYVEGAELFTCGNYVYNHYHDCKDANHFLSADNICDVICIPTNKVPEVTPVLACQDRVLRVLQVGHMGFSLGHTGCRSHTVPVYSIDLNFWLDEPPYIINCYRHIKHLEMVFDGHII